MRGLKSGNGRWVLAVCLALVIACGLLPANSFAATVPSFKVILDASIGGTIEVTLTDAGNAAVFETATVNGSGEAVFTNRLDDQTTYTLSITGMKGYKDYTPATAINPSDTNTSYTVATGSLTVSPTIDSLTKNTSGWTNQDVTVSGTASGTSVNAADEVWYSTSAADYDSGNLTGTVNGTAAVSGSNGEFSFVITANASVGKLYVWAYDTDGNKSEREDVDVNIDIASPVITGFKIEPSNSNPINFLSFGTFSNASVKVTVDAADTGGSGLDEITLHYDDGSAAGTLVSSSGVFTFPLNASSDGKLYELWAVATDDVGNASVTKRPINFAPGNNAKSNDIMLEATEPDVTLAPQAAAYSAAYKDWYKINDIPFTVDLEDAQSGLNSVKVTVTHNATSAPATVLLDEDILALTPGVKQTTKHYSLDTGALADGESEIEVTVTDNAGNVTTSSAKLNIDTHIPDIANFEIEAKHGSMDSLNFLPFGVFFNDKVVVTVTGDDMSGSGIREISLYANGNYLATATAAGGKATFELPADAISADRLLFNHGLTALAVDNVGNTMGVPAFNTEAGSRIKSNQLMIETIKPTIGIDAGPAAYTDSGRRDWYDQPVAFAVSISDGDSGIAAVAISLNGKAITSDNNGTAVNAAFYSSQTKDQSFTVHTDQGVSASDGSYTLSVTVTDNAGNRMVTTQKIYLDTAAPAITGFTFKSVDVQDADSQNALVEQTDYGYYFKLQTRVIIAANDKAPASGVRSITYYTVDISGGMSEEITVLTTGDITFVMPANFKGRIYAKATDNVGNTSVPFTPPDDAIVETKSKHQEESHIAFRKAATLYKDSQGRELYAKNTAVHLTVTDTFSGLARVEWTVTSPQDKERNIDSSIDISNGMTLTGDTSGWKVAGTDNNLITKMTGTVMVTGNSNAIRLWVKITDRAGNTSEKAISFSIDKTAPTISVTYDNNDQDSSFADFYKADRTATITIQERNFRASDVQTSITNTDGAAPKVSGFRTIVNKSNPDLSIHRATVRYAADGDYTFDIRYKDNARNSAAPFRQHAFTIDKTIPTIAVAYDNNSRSAHGEYYNAERTATITITEHNFETSRVKITGSGTNDGAGIAFPSASSWSTRGDVHTASIKYSGDARYTFTIAYQDKAGNDAADFAAHEFVVDKTPPELLITGVADKSANRGDVIPVISFSDTNYNADAVSFSLVGKVPPGGRFTSQHNGQVYTFDNFKREQEVDDIYTLTAKLTDLAGNETSQTITFSVNRFGSVYTFENSLAQLGGKYIQSEDDVVVTETNVDRLQHDSIRVKITQNGIPRDLAEGRDYTVKQAGGDGTWSQYQYNIPKAMFAGEGSYVVTLYSVDAAGNVNENIQDSKKAEISFGVDKTPPIIVAINLESGRQYPVESLDAQFSVSDNLVLKDVAVYLNGLKLDTDTSENQTFAIAASGSKQSVRVVATDAAGNESTLDVSDLLVTTSIISRWYNDTPLFIGSLIGIIVLASLAVFRIRKVKARGRA